MQLTTVDPTTARPATDPTTPAGLRRYAPVLLRVALGVVFVWFGALKIANVTPVAALVADTLEFVPVPPELLLPALGAFEVLAGVLLIAGRLLRPVLAVLVAHLVGTFLVLVTLPGVAFQDGNPLLLSTEGEFVVKNLVLVAAALAVAATLPPRRR